jgi:signal transduction histidine kinase
MEKRMSEIDGKLNIDSKEAKGTVIKLEVTLKNTPNAL